MRRRSFLEKFGLAGAGVLSPALLCATESAFCNLQYGSELTSELVIIGGGLGGCAAALAACQLGTSVIMTEPTDWIGGQVSQQGVPPDEHQWIESIGGTASYSLYRQLVRDFYHDNYPLTQAAKNSKFLNPGNGAVSRICHEPKVSVTVLQSMLAEHVSTGMLRILLNTSPIAATMEGDAIRSISCENRNAGEQVELLGKMYIDASEEGDLLPLTNTEYVIGSESQAQTGEPHAPPNADPENIQAMTHCFAVDHLEGEDHRIDKPEMYEFWNNHTPDLIPPWSGKILSLDYSFPRTLAPKTLSFVPCSSSAPPPKTDTLNLWVYRRMIDRDNFKPGTFASDISLINWPQNDYMLGNITDVPVLMREENLFKAKQLSLSLLYWLQTEAPRPDGKQGWRGLRLRKDIMGTEDGLAKYPYIRESRRIKAEYTILEQDLTLDQRKKVVDPSEKQILAKAFRDSVGIGYYHLDLHPSTGGDNYIDTPSVPFQIPLGSLIPKRVENLIPACKNIGTTHISNGCYRLHPVEWSIGEAAGSLCSYGLTRKTIPRKIRNNPDELGDFQRLLVKRGVELEWKF